MTRDVALGVAALAALVVGVLVLRTSGVYFIMVTLAFAQMAYYVVHDTPLGGGTDGIYLNVKPVLGSLIDLDKPLALYIFAERDAVIDRILTETSSGGVCVNATLYHLVPPTLPFGGVGESGQGAYHGRSTFETFSHRKSVLRKPTRLDPPIAYPPYTEQKQKLIRRFL